MLKFGVPSSNPLEPSPQIDVSVDSTATLASQAGQWFGRASVKVLDDGTVVLCYREGSEHDVNDGELHIKFSDDYGATWTAEDVDLDSNSVSGFPMNPTGAGAGEDAGEPWLYLADNGDLILHMWRVDYNVSNNGTHQSISSDGGNTWPASSQVDFGGIADDNDTFSTDDDFVVGGVIYAGARIYDSVDVTGPCQEVLIKSTDNGATWSLVSVIISSVEGEEGDGALEVGLEYVGNDTIVALLRSVGTLHTYQRISTDLGLTWGDLIDVTFKRLGISGRHRIYTRAHIKKEANWWEDSVLIATGFVHGAAGSSFPRRNCIWISRNAGLYWEGPFYIDDSYTDAGYSDIFWNPLTSQYVVISYVGTASEAVLKQYNLTIDGI